jgi:hypothetical protein
MDAPGDRAVLKLEAVARALSQLAQVGAEAYANGGHRAEPIVVRHFTPGNAARYGWAPLSPSYAARKAAGLVHSAGGYHYLNPHQKAQVDLIRAIHDRARKRDFKAGKDDNAERRAELKDFASAQAKADKKHVEEAIGRYTQGRRGSKLHTTEAQSPLVFGASARGAESNLPMLVLTGKLREAVLSRQHPIKVEGNVAYIEFQVPQYAHYLQDGTDKMPRRSPVDPNEEDAAAVRAEMQKYLDAQLRTGGRVPVSQTSVPGMARTDD